MRRVVAVLTLPLAVLLIGAATTSSQAGDGSLRQGADRIYLDIAVSFLYHEDDMDSWQPMFDAASELLWNATERQVQLGEVTFCNDSEHKSTVDIWIEQGTQGAKANVGALGGTGRVWLSQTHKSHSGSVRGQFGLVHELGHYLFGLYDEYKGVLRDGGAGGGLIKHTVNGSQTIWWSDGRYFCVTDSSTVASIMDGGTTVSPENQRTEFCTDPADGFGSTSHRPGEYYSVDDVYVELAQQYKNGESCWETMVDTMSDLAFALSAPGSEPQDSTTGHEEVTYRDCGGMRLVLCIDRSGSMSGTRIALARSAARTFVGLAEDGDEVGVSAFSSSAYVVASIIPISSEGDRNALQAAINTISAGGMTAMGAGLRTSLNMIVARGDPTGSETVILMSDGHHNTGEHPTSVLADLQGRGVKVHTVGIGQGADASLLGNIAAATGGKYYFADSAADLVGIFTALSGEVHEQGILERESGVVAQGDEVAHWAEVDGLAGTVSFTLTWGGSDLDLTLITPSATVIDPAAAAARPDVDFMSGDTYESYSVHSPETGVWQAIVTAVSVADTETYNLQVEGEDPEVLFEAWMSKAVYFYPEQVLIYARVNAPDPVTGAEVTGTVTRPDSSTAGIVLYDDGTAEHGDEFGGDGVYSNYFGSYLGSGSYTFELTVVNTEGTTILPVLPFVETETSEPVPPFTRHARTAAVVENVPEIMTAYVDVDPSTLNLRSRGRWITCYISLPEPYLVDDIDPDSILLRGTLSPRWVDIQEQVLMAKFSRRALQTLLVGMEGEVELTVDLSVYGAPMLFQGSDVVTVMYPGRQP